MIEKSRLAQQNLLAGNLTPALETEHSSGKDAEQDTDAARRIGGTPANFGAQLKKIAAKEEPETRHDAYERRKAERQQERKERIELLKQVKKLVAERREQKEQ